MADQKPLKFVSGQKAQFSSTDTIPTSNLGTGTGTSVKALFGDQTWKNFPIGAYQISCANGVTLSNGVTVYAQPAFGNSFNATETNRQVSVRSAGTIRDLIVRTQSAQPASGSLVITFRKAAAATALTLTIAAGSAAGTFSDNSNTVNVALNDLVGFKIVNNATTTSANILEIAVAIYYV